MLNLFSFWNEDSFILVSSSQRACFGGEGKGREENCSRATPSKTFSRVLLFHFKLELIELELYQ